MAHIWQDTASLKAPKVGENDLKILIFALSPAHI